MIQMKHLIMMDVAKDFSAKEDRDFLINIFQ